MFIIRRRRKKKKKEKEKKKYFQNSFVSEVVLELKTTYRTDNTRMMTHGT